MMDEELRKQVYEELGVKIDSALKYHTPPTDKQLLEFINSKLRWVKEESNRVKYIDEILTQLDNVKDELKRRRRMCTASVSGAKRSLTYELGKRNIQLNIIIT